MHLRAQVCQDFDPKRFNFTKVPQKEILFQLDETAHAASMEQSAALGDSPNLVLINVSPIEYGHVLLVPRVMDCLPQVLFHTDLCHQQWLLDCCMRVGVVLITCEQLCKPVCCFKARVIVVVNWR